MRQLMHPDDQKEPQDETFLQGVLHVVISFWLAALIEVLCALAGVIKRELGRRKGE